MTDPHIFSSKAFQIYVILLFISNQVLYAVLKNDIAYTLSALDRSGRSDPGWYTG
jgi:hypothetical protein